MDHRRVTSCLCVTWVSPPKKFRRLAAESQDYHLQWRKWTSQDWDSLFYPIVNKINIRLDITSNTFLKLEDSAYHVCVIWSLESHWREGEDGDDTDWIWLRTPGQDMVATCQTPGTSKPCVILCFYCKWAHHLQNESHAVMKTKLETSEWDHKLIRKLFTEVINSGLKINSTVIVQHKSVFPKLRTQKHTHTHTHTHTQKKATKLYRLINNQVTKIN